MWGFCHPHLFMSWVFSLLPTSFLIYSLCYRYIISNPSLNFMYRPWFLFLMPHPLSAADHFLIDRIVRLNIPSSASDQCLLSFLAPMLSVITFFHLYRYLHGIYRLWSNPLHCIPSWLYKCLWPDISSNILLTSLLPSFLLLMQWFTYFF